MASRDDDLVVVGKATTEEKKILEKAASTKEEEVVEKQSVITSLLDKAKGFFTDDKDKAEVEHTPAEEKVVEGNASKDKKVVVGNVSTEEEAVVEKASAITSLLDSAKGFFVEKLTTIPTPEAAVDDVDFKGVTYEGVDYHAKISVKNPYPVPIPVCEISYILKSNKSPIASGTIPDPGSLVGSGTTILDVPIKVLHSIVISLMQDIALDWDIDYQLDIGLTFDLPVVGNITIPISTQGEIKLPSLADFF